MTMITLALAAVLGLVQPPSAAKSPDATRAIVKSYLEIQAHLAADRYEDLKGPSSLLVSQAAALGKEGTELARAASTFAAASTLVEARDAFGPLSDAVIARVKADGSADVAAELRLGFCPMNRKSWLQREEQVRNPYYGTKMLTCGDLKPVK